uniref:Uncharacterized protein n=1 Tax=Arundo donax TaxID=35708 RepID=A0A0A9Q4V4_ARUDO
MVCRFGLISELLDFGT